MKINPICDMHCHLREGDLLESTLYYNIQPCDYLIAMPNLKDPVTDLDKLLIYKEEVEKARSKMKINSNCQILYTMYLTKELHKNIIKLSKWKQKGLFAVKLYPKGLTTNSEYGLSVKDLNSKWLRALLEELNYCEIPLLCHGEVPGTNCIVAENKFLSFVEKFLNYTRRIVLEHITTAEAADFVIQNEIAATITAHHLRLTIDDVVGQPNNYCKPVAKFDYDRMILIDKIRKGHKNFFLGTDSAPHFENDKFKIQKPWERCCAGCYTSPYIIPLLAETFEEHGILHQFDNFTRQNAMSYYNLRIPEIERTLEVVKESQQIESKIYGVIPFMANQILSWKLI